MTMGSTCASCGSEELLTVAVIEDLPVHVGVLWSTPEAARACAKGRMQLEFCPSCGLLANTAFDPNLLDYTLEYDNSLNASAIFREFETGLVDDLVARHELTDKRIVEIGGGAGRLLGMLCSAGNNRGFGFDPSIGEDRTSADGLVSVRAEFFTNSTELDGFDLLCCRQVLEHVPDLHGFLDPISATMNANPNAVAYFDVPNTSMLLRDLSVWDLIYEHCYYFLEESLRSLMLSVGLVPDRIWPSFDGQFLSLEASAAAGTSEGSTPLPKTVSPEVAAEVNAFAGHLERRRAEWTSRLRDARASGKRIAIWGAGARAVSFLSMLGITDEVAYLVDANERKQGTFMAGSGHAILPPATLAEDPVDIVIIVNGIYEEEIGGLLKDMDVDSTLVVA